MKKPYYISTAIAYTSGKPHIGNTYELVLADAIARYKRLKEYDVYFQTGTDEHGEKIELKANEKGMTTQSFVDGVTDDIKSICDKMNISYDRFVRTTDPIHELMVQKIFKKLYDQDDIYKGVYEGLYCTPCESFFTDSQLVEGRCPDCNRDVQSAKEESYFFRLSKYQDRLIDYIEKHPEFIQPESRKNEMINNFLKPGLQDLCVSRTSFTWGVPVSFDTKHVVYVWIDALTNYITNLGYDVDGSSDDYKKYWPCDLHLVGKDIIRFHTIYWPIILMALGEKLPKQIFGHPWLLFGKEKMSKSKNNVIYPDQLVDFFGLDSVRYYVLHEMPFANDGTITYELIIERTNSDLSNVLGNLVNRTISMAHKYFEGSIINKSIVTDLESSFIKEINNLGCKIDAKMKRLEVGSSLEDIIELLRRSNKYIDETAPWVLAKEESKREYLETVLYNLVESIRVSAYWLQPFLPDTALEIANQLRVDLTCDHFEEHNQYNLGFATPIFMRIDKEKKLEEINNILSNNGVNL